MGISAEGVNLMPGRLVKSYDHYCPLLPGEGPNMFKSSCETKQKMASLYKTCYPKCIKERKKEKKKSLKRSVTEETIYVIGRMANRGFKVSHIAEILGLSRSTINKYWDQGIETVKEDAA